LKILISDEETKQALCDYINHRFKISIKPTDLTPVMETEVAYEDTRSYQKGWSFDIHSDLLLN